jgi:hypothetical protein
VIARAAVLLIAALLAAGCDVLDETFNEVQKEHGVDLRNPVDAATAVSGADATGNKDAADGLRAMKGFRRAEHESKGDARYERAAAELPAGASPVSTPLTVPASKADLLRWAGDARARAQ